MSPCSTHVHHKPKFPIQFLPDPRIFPVNILPMAQPLLPNTGYTQGTKTKDAFLSVTIQLRCLISLTWMTRINTCSYTDGTAVTTITLPFGLWLNTHNSVIVCGEKWLDKTVPGKKCLLEIQERKIFHEHNPIHVLQTSFIISYAKASVLSLGHYGFRGGASLQIENA